jgi:O-antigen/teichoic acid export membrane protein
VRHAFVPQRNIPLSTDDPYGSARVLRGAAHLVGGKAVVSIAGIGTFLLLVGQLPVEQFAVYTILFGLVDLTEAITGVGLSQVLSRYVPELHVRGRAGPMRRLIRGALALRLAVLALALAGLHLATPSLAPAIGLAGWEWALSAYLLVVLLRVTAMSLHVVLESVLNQAIGQAGFGLATGLRFVLLAGFASQGTLDLKTVILVELATDGLGALVMLVGLLRTLPRPAAPEPAADREWVRSNLRRMAGFGLRGYAQHLLILPSGGATGRLLVGGALPGPEVALYGFAQSVVDILHRYLPVKLFAGVIRPVLTARYVRDGRFEDLAQAANLIVKLNAVPICLAAVVIHAGGPELLSRISGGRFGGAVDLLLVCCAVVFMSSLRHMLDHLAHVVERNGALMWSNAVITLAVIPGFALLPVLGVFALPVAHFAGLLAGSAVLLARLRADGFDLRHDLPGLARILAATALAAAASAAARWAGAQAVLAVPVGVAVLAAMLALLRPWGPDERRRIGELTRQARSRRGAP